MKIALMPGHARASEGAVVCVGYYKDFGEFALASLYMPAVASELEKLGHEVVMAKREDAGGTTPSYSARAANATGADIALEFHFNSAGSYTTGAEVLYYAGSDNPTGRKFAELLGARMAAVVGVRHRGAKGLTFENRGYSAVQKSRMPFFLLEPCFAGSNENEARLFGSVIKEGRWASQIARAIHESIFDVYN